MEALPRNTGPSVPPPSRTRSPQAQRLAVAALLMVLCWVLFLQFMPRVLPPVEAPAPAPAPAAAPPEPVKEAPPPAPAPPEEASTEPAGASLQTLEAKLDRLADLTARQPADDGALRQLEEKLRAQGETLEALKLQQQRALRIIALMDAYDRLKERVFSGRPYAQLLQDMQRAEAAPLAEPLKALAPEAETGIATLPALQAAFDAAARRALRPEPARDAGVWARFMYNMGSLVALRRVGAVEGDAPEALLARAETALGKGDAEGALAALALLKGPAAEALKPWVEQARAYVTREARLSALKAAIFTPEAPAPSPAAAP